MKSDPAKAVAIVVNNFKGQGFDVSEAAVKLLLSKVDVTPDYMPELKQYLTKEAETMVAKKQIRPCPTGARTGHLIDERGAQVSLRSRSGQLGDPQ